MPPSSRGLLLLCAAHRPRASRPSLRPRHASTKLPTRIPETLRPQSKPRAPTAKPVTPTDPPPAKPLPPKPSHWARILYLRLRSNALVRFTVLLLPCLPIAAAIRDYSPITIRPIEGPSMKPIFNPDWTSELGDLNPKTQALVQKFHQHHTRDRTRDRNHPTLPARGSIIVFRSPQNPSRIGVKRLVALPGDFITPLHNSPLGPSPIPIPFNHVWVEGDVADTAKSLDSNTFGPICANLILETVILTLPDLQPWRSGHTFAHADYPARRRVKESANPIPRHPDDESAAAAFRNGQIRAALDTVLAYPVATRPLTPMERQRWEELHRVAVAEKEKKDIETYELADRLESELRAKLSGKAVTQTLRNVQMSREEFAAFQRDGVVPEAVLTRTAAAAADS